MILAGITLALTVALSLWSFLLAGRPAAPRWLRWLPLLLGVAWAAGTAGTWLSVDDDVERARTFLTAEIAALLVGLALLIFAQARSVSNRRRDP